MAFARIDSHSLPEEVSERLSRLAERKRRGEVKRLRRSEDLNEKEG